ncbi:MAG: hypothetical protein WDW36_003212 [Sanguina aurantia]
MRRSSLFFAAAFACAGLAFVVAQPNITAAFSPALLSAVAAGKPTASPPATVAPDAAAAAPAPATPPPSLVPENTTLPFPDNSTALNSTTAPLTVPENGTALTAVIPPSLTTLTPEPIVAEVAPAPPPVPVAATAPLLVLPTPGVPTVVIIAPAAPNATANATAATPAEQAFEKRERMTTCTDVPPGTVHTCAEQKALGKCEAPWMVNYYFCSETCGHAPCAGNSTEAGNSTSSGPSEGTVEIPVLLVPVPVAAENTTTVVKPKKPSFKANGTSAYNYTKDQAKTLYFRKSNCTDVPPGTMYNCTQQRSFGKCDASWMVDNHYCSKTCGQAPCEQCSDNPPSEISCQDQAKYGKCGADFMKGYCKKSCGVAPCPPLQSYKSPKPPSSPKKSGSENSTMVQESSSYDN